MRVRYKNILIVISFFLFLSSCSTTRLSNSPLEGKIDLQGHRGARGARLENTIPAFIYCIDQGMDTIELDTHLTLDKQLIIHHDDYLNCKIALDENGNPVEDILISSLTVEELKKYDYGTKTNPSFTDQIAVPGTKLVTLPEMFSHIEGYIKENKIQRDILYNIELKFNDDLPITEDMIKESAKIIVKNIEEAQLIDKVTVQSFVLQSLVKVKNLNENIKTSALFVPSIFGGVILFFGADYNSDEIISKTISIGADFISPFYLYINDEFISKCHKLNLKVLPWTINNRNKIRKFFNMGIDGIMSDYPDRLNEEYRLFLENKK